MKNDVIRKLRKIDENNVLDFEKYNILPIGTDEMFVRIKDSNTHYISNYGRCIGVTDEVRVLTGYMNTNGKLTYSVPVWIENKRIVKNIVADRLVVENFFECELVDHIDFIWHSGFNKEDNYYLNLYVMGTKPYKALKKFVLNGGIDTEEVILNMINTNAINEPTVLGVGYWGMPEVDVKHWTFIKWHNMITRCYSDACHKKQPTYIGCTVCEEWLNYANYKKWCEENYYYLDDEIVEVDKDILVKGNTIYSPETCVFAPKSINSLFVNNKASRGDCPIGVFKTQQGKYRVCLQQKTIGNYDNIVEAFEVYKENKERLIKEIADKYRNKIPEKLYNAMVNWVVEYDD
ncbi:MAG: hypothetical protein IKW30_03105 [Lachnospiraceae bacterium]|nr:hypothetical protein [Lachnospiraceae bacterium]